MNRVHDKVTAGCIKSWLMWQLQGRRPTQTTVSPLLALLLSLFFFYLHRRETKASKAAAFISVLWTMGSSCWKCASSVNRWWRCKQHFLWIINIFHRGLPALRRQTKSVWDLCESVFFFLAQFSAAPPAARMATGRRMEEEDERKEREEKWDECSLISIPQWEKLFSSQLFCITKGAQDALYMANIPTARLSLFTLFPGMLTCAGPRPRFKNITARRAAWGFHTSH